MRGRWSSSVLSYCKNCVVKETQINTESTIVLLRQDLPSQTGPRSAVGNVSGRAATFTKFGKRLHEFH